MTEASAEFGPQHNLWLDDELLRALVAGSKVSLQKLLREESPQTNGQITINLRGTAPAGVAAAPELSGSCRLIGVTSNGSTALHVVAIHGHAELAGLICERAPSLAATRNRCLDTPLHCAARAGHRDVAACILRTMMQASTEAADSILQARNKAGATALHEAVRHGRVGVVDLLMETAPSLAAVTTDGGVSPLYMAAAAGSADSVQMVHAILRPLRNGAPSPASAAGPEGRTALHAAAIRSTKEISEAILSWEPEGPTLLTRDDLSGKTPLHFAVIYGRLDIVQLFLGDHASLRLTSISDNDGSYPLHAAAMFGRTKIIDELVQKCPNYYELVDDKGGNFLHIAVQYEMEMVVRHICQNDIFAMLLNATDYDGNTPLHLAVKQGYPRIFGLLLETTGVDMCITNKDGHTATDLACCALTPEGLRYFPDPQITVLACLWWVREPFSLNHRALHIHDLHALEDEPSSKQQHSMTKNITIGSVLIATVAFAAAFTLPGGVVADDHPRAGTAILSSRFAFRAFVVTDTMAFLYSIMATCFVIYGKSREIPRIHRQACSLLASGLFPCGAQFLIGAFAFGFHLVLGTANRWLMIFVYMVSSMAVLLCFPSIWAPFRFGLRRAIWRRYGWRGLINMHRRPSSPLDFFVLVFTGPLIDFRRTLFALVISATFVIAIALDIAMPNY
uniref:PGG domain-containing protein n=1 Tax=Leersia perrieri TaxID=77586 RepID=A0A0D9WZS7_9ORYZ